MNADDPRHGTYAGFQAHKADKTSACAACREANYRYVKRMKARVAKGQRNLVPLGERAWRMLGTYPLRSVARASGVSDSKLYGYYEGGPETVVNIRTRHAILSIRGLHTTVGIQRRVRALTRLGYSAEVIAAESGVNPATIQKWRSGPAPTWVREPTAEAIIACYDRLSMSLADPSRSATRARTLAESRGWLPPMAYDDIDLGLTGAVEVVETDHNDVDPVLVDRILSGDMTLARTATKAERVEVVARWRAAGRPLNELERLTSWEPRRYVRKAA